MQLWDFGCLFARFPFSGCPRIFVDFDAAARYFAEPLEAVVLESGGDSNVRLWQGGLFSAAVVIRNKAALFAMLSLSCRRQSQIWWLLNSISESLLVPKLHGFLD
jgi:hypothetical protein